MRVANFARIEFYSTNAHDACLHHYHIKTSNQRAAMGGLHVYRNQRAPSAKGRIKRERESTLTEG